MKYRIEIGGRGGEIVIGSVKKEAYEFFQENEIDIEEYAYDWDNELDVPEMYQPFVPGEWHDCDNIGHSYGPSADDCYISVLDSDNNTLYDALTINQFMDLGAEQECVEEIYPQETLKPNDVYFIGQSFEKGHFYTGEFEAEAFDPNRLTFFVTDVDGWELVTGVTYDGEEIEDLGDLSTTGKGSNFQLIVVGNE